MPVMDGIEAIRECREVRHITLNHVVFIYSDQYLITLPPSLLMFQQVLQLRDLPILALSAEVGAKIKEEAVAGKAVSYHSPSLLMTNN